MAIKWKRCVLVLYHINQKNATKKTKQTLKKPFPIGQISDCQ